MAEYIEKFKEFKRRIRIAKEEVVTLNWFKKGLNATRQDYHPRSHYL